MASAVSALDQGRDLCAGRAWMRAYRAMKAADDSAPLGPEDLELLATAAYMIGREGDYLATLERAYEANLDAERPMAALRSAFWIGINLLQRGEGGRAGGWLGRARRLHARHGRECVESGYLQLPEAFAHEARGELESGAAAAATAVEAGERFGDRDLFSLAAHVQGHILIRQGRTEGGLALLDEAMVAAASGALSPIVTGIVYCGVILACQDAHDLRRGREWTAALSRWCEQQPEIVAFTGRCLIHRAEIMQLDGAPAEALAEAQRAAERCAQGENRSAVAEARYREGEIQRQLGDLAAAELAYRQASGEGRDPQPGLAMLRLAQGEGAAAAATISRASEEASAPAQQAELLPACVEIMLAVGEIEAAREASDRLVQLADVLGGSPVDARAAQSRGAVLLAERDAREALSALRRAEQSWQALECPYEAARARELIGLACRMLGDEETANLELEAARSTFELIGASSDLERLEGRDRVPAEGERHGLTRRELQVLHLICAGETNRGIASRLVISERTVERHASNIFAKLGVSSRSAATAHAYEHGLI